jgi:hypothetical protein
MAELHPDMTILREAQKGAYGGATIAAQRADWSRYAAILAEPPPADMTVQDRTLPVPTAPVKVRIYTAAKPSGAALLYMHGGGFMKGDLDSSDSVAWGFCAQTGATVVSVDLVKVSRISSVKAKVNRISNVKASGKKDAATATIAIVVDVDAMVAMKVHKVMIVMTLVSKPKTSALIQ